jgi:hypothetical protein
MSQQTTAGKKSKAAKQKGQQREPKPRPKGDYQLRPKDQARTDRKLQEYTALMGKSIDAETIFVAKEKDWLAALKIGRQSARDRFRAGKTLMELQQMITDEIGYPFWPWLRTMGVPEKTAQRAIELATFYKTEEKLGDKTITACYAEMKAAKAKAKVKDEQDKGEEDKNNEEGKNGEIGKDTDTVSDSLPIPPSPAETEPEEEADETEDWDEEEDEKYGQESLAFDLDGIEEVLTESLKSMSGDLGSFTEPETIVHQIDKCIDLLDQLTLKVPVSP